MVIVLDVTLMIMSKTLIKKTCVATTIWLVGGTEKLF